MAGFGLARKFAIGSRPTRALPVRALAHALGVVPLTVDVARRIITFEFALLPLFADAIPVLAVSMTLTRRREPEEEDETDYQSMEANFHAQELAHQLARSFIW